MTPDMLELDGSQGEGGGQIARTALSLSMLLQRPFRIHRIRANRPSPGLKDQHVSAIRLLCQMSDARAEGATVGSRELEFNPAPPRAGAYEFDIRTAGSISLLLQTVLPVVAITPGTTSLRLIGGTDVPWSPTMAWFEHVYLPWLRPWAVQASVQTARRGFYPRGGGRVDVSWTNRPSDVADLDAIRRHARETLGAERSVPGSWTVHGLSLATDHLASARVAERQAEAATATLVRAGLAPTIDVQTVSSPSPGSSITLWASDENGNRIGADALGRKGTAAEVVGQEAADALRRELEGGGTVDRHLADHVVPWVALSQSRVRLSHTSTHLETNVETVRRFLGPDSVALDSPFLGPPRRSRATA